MDSLNLYPAQFNVNGSNSNGENGQISLLSPTETVLQKYALANNTDGKRVWYGCSLKLPERIQSG